MERLRIPPGLRRAAPLIAIGAAVVLGLGLAVFVGILALGGDMPSPDDLAKDPMPLATKVYAADGAQLLYEFAEERREPVRFDELPKVLVDATIAAEDHSFWTNPGIDGGAILRAAVENTRAGGVTQGASTITQQLIRARVLTDERTFTRKAKEALLAVEVTRRYPKREILEMYFNQIYYGAQSYGVKAAARVYFGNSDLSKLTLAQAALLAGLPQAPSLYDPTKPGKEADAKARRAYVLDQMVRSGAATQTEADRAKAEPLGILPDVGIKISAPHFVFQVKRELARILGSESAVTRGGFTVVTSIIPALQTEAEKQVSAHVARLGDRNVHNAALVAMDPRTGQVVAYVGSVDYANSSDPKVQGQFDVASIGERQPGSAFKVFTYTTALKRGATPATVVVDASTDFGGGYRPENADLQYHGPVTMRQAIRESRNVPAVKFLQRWAGIDETIQTARDMGITADFASANAGLSLTLGAVPVKLIDMTTAFAALANGGESVRPQLVMKIHDPRGKMTYHFEPEKRRVLTPEIAWLMTDILKDTTQPDRSLYFGGFTNIGRPAALKTGTTDNFKDVYSVGYTPQIVTGVWMGNSDGDPMSSRDLSSALGPGQLWRDFMKKAHEGVEVKDWERPPGIVQATVAVAPGGAGGYGSGLLPSDRTPFTTSEWFVKGAVPSKADDWFGAGCATASASASASPVTTPPAGSSGAGAGSMVIKEDGVPGWARDRDAWIAQAMAGRHDYGRFPWSRILRKEGPCPSPSASASPSPSASASASVSPSASAPRPSLPVPTPTAFVTPPPVTTPPRPTPTPLPTRVP